MTMVTFRFVAATVILSIFLAESIPRPGLRKTDFPAAPGERPVRRDHLFLLRIARDPADLRVACIAHHRRDPGGHSGCRGDFLPHAHLVDHRARHRALRCRGGVRCRAPRGRGDGIHVPGRRPFHVRGLRGVGCLHPSQQEPAHPAFRNCDNGLPEPLRHGFSHPILPARAKPVGGNHAHGVAQPRISRHFLLRGVELPLRVRIVRASGRSPSARTST